MDSNFPSPSPRYNKDLEDVVNYADQLRQTGQPLPMEMPASTSDRTAELDTPNHDDVLSYWEQNHDKQLDYNHPDAKKIWEDIVSAHKNRLDDWLGAFAEGAKQIAGLPADIVEGMVERPNPLVWATSTAEGVGRMVRDMYGMFVHSANPDSPFFWAKSHIQAVLNGKPSKDWKEEVEQWNQTRAFLYHSSRVQAGDDSVFKYYLNLSDENNKRVNSFVNQKVAHGMAFLGLELPALFEAGFTAGASQVAAVEAMSASSGALRAARAARSTEGIAHAFHNAATKLEQFTTDLSRVAVGNTLNVAGKALSIPAGIVGNVVGGSIESLANASGISRNALVANAVKGAEAIGASEVRQTVGFFGSLGLRTTSEYLQELGTEMATLGKGVVPFESVNSLSAMERVALNKNLSTSASKVAKFASVIIDPIVGMSSSALQRGYRNAIEFGLLGYGNDKGRGAGSGAGMGFVWGGYSGALRGMWSRVNGELSHQNLKDSFDRAIPELAKLNPSVAESAVRITTAVDPMNSTLASSNARVFVSGIVQIAGKEISKLRLWTPRSEMELVTLIERNYPNWSPQMKQNVANHIATNNGIFFPSRENPLIAINMIEGRKGGRPVLDGLHEGFGHYANYMLRERGMIGDLLRQYHGTDETNGAGGTDEQKADRAARLYAYHFATRYAVALWNKLNPNASWESIGQKKQLDWVNKVAEDHFNSPDITPPKVSPLGNEINTPDAFNGFTYDNGIKVRIPNGQEHLYGVGEGILGGKAYFRAAYKHLRLMVKSDPNIWAGNLKYSVNGVDNIRPAIEAVGNEIGNTLYGDALYFAYEEASAGTFERLGMHTNLEGMLMDEEDAPFRMYVESRRRERYARMLTDAELAGIRVKHGQFAGISEGEITDIGKFEAFDDGVYRMSPEMDGFARNLVRAAINIDEGGIAMMRPERAAHEAKIHNKEFLFNFTPNGATLKGTKQLNDEAADRAGRAINIIESESNAVLKLDVDTDEHGNKSVNLLNAKDALIDKLVASHAIDRETARIVKVMRDGINEYIKSGYSTPNIYAGFYWGDSSRRVRKGNIFRRITGDDVPVTHRVFVPFEVKLVFRTKDANGKTLNNPRGGLTGTVVDYMAIHRRKMKMWARPDVQRIFNSLEHFSATFDAYMINMMQEPSVRLPSAELFRTEFGQRAEQVRDMMYETFGARKRNDEAYANPPREGYNSNPENPDYPIHSMKLEMLVGAELTSNAPFPYHHLRSYEPLRVNKSVDGFSRDSKQFERYSDRLGYSIINNAGKFSVFDPFGAKVGAFESLKRAVTAAKKNSKKLDSADLMPAVKDWEDSSASPNKEGEQPKRFDNYVDSKTAQYHNGILLSINGEKFNWQSEFRPTQDINAKIDDGVNGKEFLFTDLFTGASNDSLGRFVEGEKCFDFRKLRIIPTNTFLEQQGVKDPIPSRSKLYANTGMVANTIPASRSGTIVVAVDFKSLATMTHLNDEQKATILKQAALTEAQRIYKAFRKDSKNISYFSVPVEMETDKSPRLLAHRTIGQSIERALHATARDNSEAFKSEYQYIMKHIPYFHGEISKMKSMDEFISFLENMPEYPVTPRGIEAEMSPKAGSKEKSWEYELGKSLLGMLRQDRNFKLSFEDLQDFFKAHNEIIEAAGNGIFIKHPSVSFKDSNAGKESLSGTIAFRDEDYDAVMGAAERLTSHISSSGSPTLARFGEKFNHVYHQLMWKKDKHANGIKNFDPSLGLTDLGPFYAPRVDLIAQSFFPNRNKPMFILTMGPEAGFHGQNRVGFPSGIVVVLGQVGSKGFSKLLINNESGAPSRLAQKEGINKSGIEPNMDFPLSACDSKVVDYALDRRLSEKQVIGGTHIRHTLSLLTETFGKDMPELAGIKEISRSENWDARLTAIETMRVLAEKTGKPSLFYPAQAAFGLEQVYGQAGGARFLMESRKSHIDPSEQHNALERFKDEANTNWHLALQDFWGISENIRDETKFEKAIAATRLEGGKSFEEDLASAKQTARALRTFHLQDADEFNSSQIFKSVGSPRVIGDSVKIQEMKDAGLIREVDYNGRKLTLFEFSDAQAALIASKTGGDISLLPFAEEVDPKASKEAFIGLMQKAFGGDEISGHAAEQMALRVMKPTTLGEIFDHPLLYKYYPELRSLKVYWGTSATSSFYFGDNIELTPSGEIKNARMLIGTLPLFHSEISESKMLSDDRYLSSKSVAINPIAKTILHEVQHYLQLRENMGFDAIPYFYTMGSKIMSHYFPNLAGVKGSGLIGKEMTAGVPVWKYLGQMIVEHTEKMNVYKDSSADHIEAMGVFKQMSDSPLFKNLDANLKPMMSKLCQSLAVYGEMMGKPVDGVVREGLVVDDVAPIMRDLPRRFENCVKDADFLQLAKEISELHEKLLDNDSYYFMQKGDSATELAFMAIGLHSSLGEMKNQTTYAQMAMQFKSAFKKYAYIHYLLRPEELMARETESRAKMDEGQLIGSPRQYMGSPRFDSIIDILNRTLQQSSLHDIDELAKSMSVYDKKYEDPSIRVFRSIGGIKGDKSDNPVIETFAKASLVMHVGHRASEELKSLTKFIIRSKGWEVGEDGKISFLQGHYVVRGDYQKFEDKANEQTNVGDAITLSRKAASFQGAVPNTNRTYTIADIAALADLVIESENVFKVNNGLLDLISSDSFPDVFAVKEIKGELDKVGSYSKAAASACRFDSIIESLHPEQVITKNDLLNMLCVMHRDLEVGASAKGDFGLPRNRPLPADPTNQSIVNALSNTSVGQAIRQQFFPENMFQRVDTAFKYGIFAVDGKQVVFSAEEIPWLSVDERKQLEDRVNKSEYMKRIRTTFVWGDSEAASNLARELNERVSRRLSLVGPFMDKAKQQIAEFGYSVGTKEYGAFVSALMNESERNAVKVLAAFHDDLSSAANSGNVSNFFGEARNPRGSWTANRTIINTGLERMGGDLSEFPTAANTHGRAAGFTDSGAHGDIQSYNVGTLRSRMFGYIEEFRRNESQTMSMGARFGLGLSTGDARAFHERPSHSVPHGSKATLMEDISRTLKIPEAKGMYLAGSMFKDKSQFMNNQMQGIRQMLEEVKVDASRTQDALLSRISEVDSALDGKSELDNLKSMSNDELLMFKEALLESSRKMTNSESLIKALVDAYTKELGEGDSAANQRLNNNSGALQVLTTKGVALFEPTTLFVENPNSQKVGTFGYVGTSVPVNIRNGIIRKKSNVDMQLCSYLNGLFDVGEINSNDQFRGVTHITRSFETNLEKVTPPDSSFVSLGVGEKSQLAGIVGGSVIFTHSALIETARFGGYPDVKTYLSKPANAQHLMEHIQKPENAQAFFDGLGQHVKVDDNGNINISAHALGAVMAPFILAHNNVGFLGINGAGKFTCAPSRSVEIGDYVWSHAHALPLEKVVEMSGEMRDFQGTFAQIAENLTESEIRSITSEICSNMNMDTAATMLGVMSLKNRIKSDFDGTHQPLARWDENSATSPKTLGKFIDLAVAKGNHLYIGGHETTGQNGKIGIDQYENFIKAVQSAMKRPEFWHGYALGLHAAERIETRKIRHNGENWGDEIPFYERSDRNNERTTCFINRYVDERNSVSSGHPVSYDYQHTKVAQNDNVANDLQRGIVRGKKFTSRFGVSDAPLNWNPRMGISVRYLDGETSLRNALLTHTHVSDWNESYFSKNVGDEILYGASELEAKPASDSGNTINVPVAPDSLGKEVRRSVISAQLANAARMLGSSKVAIQGARWSSVNVPSIIAIGGDKTARSAVASGAFNRAIGLSSFVSAKNEPMGQNEIPRVGFSWKRLPSGEVMLNFSPSIDIPLVTDMAAGQPKAIMGIPIRRAVGWDVKSSELVPNSLRSSIAYFSNLGGAHPLTRKNQLNALRSFKINDEVLRQHEAGARAILANGFYGEMMGQVFEARKEGAYKGPNLVRENPESATAYAAAILAGEPVLSKDYGYRKYVTKENGITPLVADFGSSTKFNDLALDMHNQNMSYVTLILPKDATLEDIHRAITPHIVRADMGLSDFYSADYNNAENYYKLSAKPHEGGPSSIGDDYERLEKIKMSDSPDVPSGRQSVSPFDLVDSGIAASTRDAGNEPSRNYANQWQRSIERNPTLLQSLKVLHERLSSSEHGYFLPDVESRIATNGDRTFAIKHLMPNRPDLLRFAWDHRGRDGIDVFKRGAGEGYIVAWNMVNGVDQNGQPVRVRKNQSFRTESEANAFADKVALASCEAEAGNIMSTNGNHGIEEITSNPNLSISHQQHTTLNFGNPEEMVAGSGKFVAGNFDQTFDSAADARKFIKAITQTEVMSSDAPVSQQIILKSAGGINPRSAPEISKDPKWLEYSLRPQIGFSTAGSPVQFSSKALRAVASGMDKHKRFKAAMSGDEWQDFMIQNGVSKAELRTLGLTDMFFRNKSLQMSRSDVAEHIYALYPRTGRHRHGFWTSVENMARVSANEGALTWPTFNSPTQLAQVATKRVMDHVVGGISALEALAAKSEDKQGVQQAIDLHKQNIERTFRAALEESIGKEMSDKVLENSSALDVLGHAVQTGTLKGDLGVLSSAIVESFRSKLNKATSEAQIMSSLAIAGPEFQIPEYGSPNAIKADSIDGVSPTLRQMASGPVFTGSGDSSDLLGKYLKATQFPHASNDDWQLPFEGKVALGVSTSPETELGAFDQRIYGFTGKAGSAYDTYASGAGPYYMDVLFAEISGRNTPFANDYIQRLSKSIKESVASGDAASAEKYTNMLTSVKAVMNIRKAIGQNFALSGGSHKHSPPYTMQLSHIRTTSGIAMSSLPVGASLTDLASVLGRKETSMIPVHFIEEIQSDMMQGKKFGVRDKEFFLPSDFKQAESSALFSEMGAVESDMQAITQKSERMFDKIAASSDFQHAWFAQREFARQALIHIAENSNPIQRYALARYMLKESGTAKQVVRDTGRVLKLSAEMSKKYGVPIDLPVYELDFSGRNAGDDTTQTIRRGYDTECLANQISSEASPSTINTLKAFWPGLVEGTYRIPNMEHIEPEGQFFKKSAELGKNLDQLCRLGMLHDENFAANSVGLVKLRQADDVWATTTSNYDYDGLAARVVEMYKQKLKAAEIALGPNSQHVSDARAIIPFLERALSDVSGDYQGPVLNEDFVKSSRYIVTHIPIEGIEAVDFEQAFKTRRFMFAEINSDSNGNSSKINKAFTYPEAVRYVYHKGKANKLWSDPQEFAEACVYNQSHSTSAFQMETLAKMAMGQEINAGQFMITLRKQSRFNHFHQTLKHLDTSLDSDTNWDFFTSASAIAINHRAKTALGRLMEVNGRYLASIIATAEDRAEIPRLNDRLQALQSKLGELKLDVDKNALPDTIPFGEDNSYRALSVYRLSMAALESNQRGLAIADARHHRTRYAGNDLQEANFVQVNGIYVPFEKGDRQAPYWLNHAQSTGAHGNFLDRLSTTGDIVSALRNGDRFEHNGATTTFSGHLEIAMEEALSKITPRLQVKGMIGSSAEAKKARREYTKIVAQYVMEQLGSGKLLSPDGAQLEQDRIHSIYREAGIGYYQDAREKVDRLKGKNKEAFLTFPNGVSWGYGANYGMPLAFNQVQMAGMGIEAQRRFAHDVYQAPVAELKDGKYHLVDPKTGKLLIGGIESLDEMHERRAQLSKYLGNIQTIAIFHKMFGKVGGYAHDSFLLGPNDQLGKNSSYEHHFTKEVIEQMDRNAQTFPDIAQTKEKLLEMAVNAGSTSLVKALSGMNAEQIAMFVKDCLAGKPTEEYLTRMNGASYVDNNGRQDGNVIKAAATNSGSYDAALHAMGITDASTPTEVAAAIAKTTTFTAPLLIIKPKYPTASNVAEMQKLIAEGIPLMSVGSFESKGEQVQRALRTFTYFAPTWREFTGARAMSNERREIEGAQMDPGSQRDLNRPKEYIAVPSGPDKPMPTRAEMRAAYPPLPPSEEKKAKANPRSQYPKELWEEFKLGVNIPFLVRKYGVKRHQIYLNATPSMKAKRAMNR